jgi:hypothetical protein
MLSWELSRCCLRLRNVEEGVLVEPPHLSGRQTHIQTQPIPLILVMLVSLEDPQAFV